MGSIGINTSVGKVVIWNYESVIMARTSKSIAQQSLSDLVQMERLWRLERWMVRSFFGTSKPEMYKRSKIGTM
jgi:hypothetical protein